MVGFILMHHKDNVGCLCFEAESSASLFIYMVLRVSLTL